MSGVELLEPAAAEAVAEVHRRRRPRLVVLVLLLAIAGCGTWGGVSIYERLHANPLKAVGEYGSPDIPVQDGRFGKGEYVIDAPKGADRRLYLGVINRGHASLTIDRAGLFDAPSSVSSVTVLDGSVERPLAGTRVAPGAYVLLLVHVVGRGCVSQPSSHFGFDALDVAYRVRGVHREASIAFDKPVIVVQPDGYAPIDPAGCLTIPPSTD